MTPDDLAPSPIEPVWFVEATYAPDGAQARLPFRTEHIARFQELKRSGIVIEIGAFTDASASVAVVRAASEEEVLALFRDDVYMRNGVWVEIRVRPFGRVRDAA